MNANLALGIAILSIWSVEGLTMFCAPGSFRFQKPTGGALVMAYNVLNLAYEFLVIPGSAVLLMLGASTVPGLLLTPVPAPASTVLRALGLLLLLTGAALLCWSRVALGRSFRLACVSPGEEDPFVTAGPYHLLRHPMYLAILTRSLGLALVMPSAAVLLLWVLLLALVLRTIPAEERVLETARPGPYAAYVQSVRRRLLPLLY